MKKLLFTSLLSLVATTLLADEDCVTIKALPDDGTPFERRIIGVNHLAYGKDGYGLLLAGRHTVDPNLISMQKEIGLKSLRYPGGCGGTHPFRWKWNAGLDGNYWVLGVVEFLDMCEKVGADPILGISSHRGSPQEAAEYVEFLNAPADEKHPWALKRKARGHEAPYAVRYFEYGNETYHGTHPNGRERARRIHPQDYARSYLAFRAAMQAVDPTIQLGVVLSSSGTGWNRRVLEVVGKNADFYIMHTYAGAPKLTTDADYLSIFLNRERGVATMIKKELAEIGDPGAKLAITEFNTTLSDHKTLTASLVNMQTLFALAAASPNVVHADYWQFVNEAFGMVRGKTSAFVKRPNALAFELFSRYTLDTLSAIAIEDPRIDKVKAREVPPEIKAILGRNFAKDLIFDYQGKRRSYDKGTETSYVRHEDGTHELKFLDDRAMNFYHLQGRINRLPKGNACNWKVSCKMCVEGMKGEDVNLDVTDGRGWTATHSAAGLPAVGSPDWIEVSTVYAPLIDNPGSLVVRFRRDGGAGRGTVLVRDLCVEAVAKEAPRASAVTGQFSLSCDRQTAALILINRSLSPRDVRVDVDSIKGFCGNGSLAKCEALTGTSAYATNEETPDAVKIVPLDATSGDKGLTLTLPAHSAAGLLLK